MKKLEARSPKSEDESRHRAKASPLKIGVRGVFMKGGKFATANWCDLKMA